MTENAVTVFVSMGSNVDPETNILKALGLLRKTLRLTGVSRFYRSAALKRPDDPEFLNGMIAVQTSIPARSLKFDVLRGVENVLGRQRGEDAYAPRTIDLAIALYGMEVIEEPGLVVPDPDILERAFLAIPLLELAPDLCWPGTGRPLAEIVAEMDTGGMSLDTDFSRKAQEICQS